MTIAIVYVYPAGWTDKAAKFLATYEMFPPGGEHQSVVVCNGGPADDETRFLFGSLPNLTLLQHDNSGQDIGAFQLAAQVTPCDIMLFLGSHTYFRRGGWLHRVRATFKEYGDNLYGATGNQGDSRVNVYPHIRTTAMWCSPGLMNRCPLRVTDASQRYPFEHGPNGLTTWHLSQPLNRAMVCGWYGEWDVLNCDQMPGGFHRGDQSNLLIGDRLTCPPYHAYE